VPGCSERVGHREPYPDGRQDLRSAETIGTIPTAVETTRP
jgi:hypothetical protein